MAAPDRSAGALRAALSACAAAAVGAALLDVVVAAARSGEPTPARAFASALAAALGLYGVLALLVGLLVGIVAASIVATVDPAARIRAWRSALADGERDRSHAGAILAAGAASLVVAAVVFGFARRFALEMASKRNGALSTAIVAVAALPIAALAWFPLYRAGRAAAIVLPRPRALFALGALAAAALVAVAVAVFSVDWRVIDFGPVYALALFAAFAIGHAWAYRRGPLARWWSARSPGTRRALPLVAAALLSASAVVTYRHFGDEPRSLALIGEETAGARPLLKIARHLADRDGDGYAPILGGGDCNDHDRAINPGAVDEPGNGVDEDCSGEDARVASVVAPKRPASARAAGYRFDGNLVVITVDTLRADRLNERVMPHLTAFARQSAVFTHAYAQAPNTPRSFPSFLTSRAPSHVKWVREFANFPAITDENTTFFEALRATGRRTVGEFSHFYLVKENGVAQGFDEWDNAGALSLHDSNTDVASPRIVARVEKKLAQLAAEKTRFVLWTHLFEPHSRYMEHPEFPSHASGVKGLEEKYDGEVSFVDLHIQKILDALAANGLDRHTAVVVFSDHGEAFGEHRLGGETLYFHGQTLYDELLRVPLVVRVPGEPGRVIDENVALLDLGPTLLDLVKGQAPPSFEGRSLLPAILGDRLGEARVYAELLPAPSWNRSWRAIVDGDRKLLYKLSENTLELYDLKGDPREQQNLANRDTAGASALKRELQAWMAQARRGPNG